MNACELFLILVGSFMAASTLIGVVFAVWGAPQVDEALRGAPIFLRILIVPGCAMFWPIMLIKWRNRIRKSENT